MAKVLVVDDSKLVLRLHSSFFEKAGFECQVSENGMLALEQLSREKFDVVVTDINMPRMDGYELTRHIRKMPEYRDTPVIIVSTEEEEIDRKKGLEAGANLYLVKPTTPEELVQSVNRLLGKGS